MRLAIVAGSTYAQNGKLARFEQIEAELDVLGQRLNEPDAGFEVHVLMGERDLGTRVERLIEHAAEPIEALIFYFCGYVAFNEERGPALLLDGARLGALPLERLRGALEKATSALVVLDTVSAFDGPSPREVTRTLSAALTVGSETIHALVAHRAHDADVSARSPFTSLLGLVLDWQSGSDGLSAEALLAAMRAEEALFAALPAVELTSRSEPFQLLASGVAPVYSVPPESLPAPSNGNAVDSVKDHTALALSCEERGELQQALAHALIAVREYPRNPTRLRTALRLFDKCGQADGAWNAACALETLGQADINESLLAGARRPDGLLPARDRVAEQDWTAKLFCPERHSAADDLFAALDGAAIEVGLETARRKRRLPALDPSTAQDPETSTATLAKTLLWTSKLLGLDVPRLHVLPELNANLLTPPAREPTLLANRALGSGLELPELAFLWGRQLTFLRPEHRLLSFYPTVPELASLVLAALSLGGIPQLPFRKLEGETKLFARSLKRHLSAAALERLSLAASRFPLRNAADATLSWCRAVELSASRAGLLACGSLEVAAKMSERFPRAGQVEPKAQLDDLLSFSLSHGYSALRERLGVKLAS